MTDLHYGEKRKTFDFYKIKPEVDPWEISKKRVGVGRQHERYEQIESTVVISGGVVEVYQYSVPIYKRVKETKAKPDVSLKIEQDFLQKNRFEKTTRELFNNLGLEYPEEYPELLALTPEVIEEMDLTDIDTLEKFAEKLKQTDKRNRQDECAKRAKAKVRRLVDANLGKHKHHDKFITLTFAEDVKDRKIAMRAFDRFVKRLRYKFDGFGYIAVTEIQDGKRREDKIGRGVYHFHMLVFNIPFLDPIEFKEIWGQGYVDVKSMHNYPDLAGYMSKYIGKDFQTGRSKYEKNYFTSRNLERPIVIKNPTPEQLAEYLNYGEEQYRNAWQLPNETVASYVKRSIPKPKQKKKRFKITKKEQ